MAEGKERFSNLVVLLFFAVYLLIGCFLVDDYGVSTDESNQINKAIITGDYIFGRNDALLTYQDRHYGAIFPAILWAGDLLFSDSREIFLYRHFVTFLSFFLGTILFYLLLRKLSFGRWLSLFTTFLLILQPHIFAQSFYNPKDIPFLTMYVLTLYTLARILEKYNPKNLAIHGIATGMLVVFRLPGILMLGISLLLFTWMYISRQLDLKKFVISSVIFLTVSVATLYVFLPVLWKNPLGQLSDFLSMAPFTWIGTELFFGTYYHLEQIPLGHPFVYFGISMPIVFLVLFFIGLCRMLWLIIVRQKLFSPSSGRIMLSLVAIFFTVEVFLVQRPGVYNGWRHELFFYPMFLLVVVEAIEWLWSAALSLKNKASVLFGRGALATVLVLQIVQVVVFMVQAHPYEFLYYNFMAGKDLVEIRQQFEMDYWGLAFREALEKITEKDQREKITIRSMDGRLQVFQNLSILPKEQRDRFIVLKSENPEKEDYMLTFYTDDTETDIPGYEMIDSVQVFGAVINGTYTPK